MAHSYKRKRKSRKQRPPPRQRLPPNVLISLTLFIVSTIFFIHQCVHPFRLRPHLRARRNLIPNPNHTTSKADTNSNPILSDVSSTQPRNWFQQAAASLAQQSSSLSSSQAFTVPQEPVSASDILDQIPEGPVPLPSLNHADDTNSSAAAVSVPAGSSWAGSLAAGVIGALPLHWVAEVAHAPPQRGEARPNADDDHGSIFAARRKGAWIGCERPFHLVCKGVYRAIKVANAVRVVDLSCDKNEGWLPHILNKLREEFRMVQLTCVVLEERFIEQVKNKYATVKDLEVVVMDVFTGTFPSRTDMLVAYKFLEDRTLIDAMRFFKNVKRSSTVDILTMETFPGLRNDPKKTQGGATDAKLRLNTALAPFWFPPPVFQYENEDENEEGVAMHITAVKVDEMFQERKTPRMQDLVDPRRRHFQE